MQNNLLNKNSKSSRLTKKLLGLIVLITSISLTSCTSLSKLGLQDYPNDTLSKVNYHDLNGLYLNRHDTIVGDLKHSPDNGLDEFEQQAIMTQLFLTVPESYHRDSAGEMINPSDKYVKIEFNTSKKATVSFYHNDRFVFSKNIKGKFKNGYFYLRPKAFIIPIVPLVFGYNFERARIGKSNNDLLIDYSVNRWGFALVAGSSNRGYTTSIYKKKD